MKRILILIFIIGMMVTKSNAQNFLGYSFYDIRDEMTLKGYSINIDKTNAGTKYLTASTHNQMRVYYFNSYNDCIRYLYTIDGATRRDLEEALQANGYTKYSDGFYYTREYKADIVYIDSFKNWVVVTDKRN